MRNFIIILLAAIVMMNCGGGGGGGTKTPTIEEQVAENLVDGWIHFENARYDSAEYYFDLALNLMNGHEESQAGKAWTLLMQDESDLAAIETYLEKAQSDTSLLNDVLAALGIVNNLQKDYSTSINHIQQLLDRSSAYVFSHKTDIDYNDMMVLQAHSYFYNKQFDRAYEVILEMTTTYVFDPDDGSTWTVDGKKYPSYEGAISAVLAKLSDQYKSF